MLKNEQSSSISFFDERLISVPSARSSLYEPPPLVSSVCSTTTVSPNRSGSYGSSPPLARCTRITASGLPCMISVEYEFVFRPVTFALHDSPAISPATIADLPEPFLPMMKLTCGSRSTRMCSWFMKFSSTSDVTTPFSNGCGALPTPFGTPFVFVFFRTGSSDDSAVAGSYSSSSTSSTSPDDAVTWRFRMLRRLQHSDPCRALLHRKSAAVLQHHSASRLLYRK